MPKALEKATREDFQTIISRKCLEDKYGQISDSLQLSYAGELRNFIRRKAKTEEEHRHLASGVRDLLDKESVSPKLLLKVLRKKLLPVKPDSSSPAVNGSKEKRGGRKRSVSADEEHTRKKLKVGRAPRLELTPSKVMEKTFEDILSREAARSSTGR